MNAFLQSINPTKPVKTEDEAWAAARAGAWGAFVMAVPSAAAALNMLLTADAYLASCARPRSPSMARAAPRRRRP